MKRFKKVLSFCIMLLLAALSFAAKVAINGAIGAGIAYMLGGEPLAGAVVANLVEIGRAHV